MMKHFFVVCSFVFTLILVSCLGENQMKVSVIEQADQFAFYLRHKQYDQYLNNMTHFVFIDEKEKQQLKKGLEQQMTFLEEHNNSITKTESLLNSSILENDGYYQCVVKQVTFYSNNFTSFKSNTYLLAISKDGLVWKFADVTNFSEAIIKNIFPELSPNLKFENDKKE